jgi:hypothetical protein
VDAGSAATEFSNAWDHAIKEAKLVGRVRHDFRRSATRRFDSMPDDLAMEFTGHKSYKIFSNYKSRIEADKREAIKKLYGSTKQVQKNSISVNSIFGSLLELRKQKHHLCFPRAKINLH